MIKLTFVAKGDLRMGCAGEAGLTLGDQIRQLAGGLTLAYGDQIAVEFLDPDRDDVGDHLLLKECMERNCVMPALFIGGELKFEGGIPIMALKSVLDSLGLNPQAFGESE